MKIVCAVPKWNSLLDIFHALLYDFLKIHLVELKLWEFGTDIWYLADFLKLHRNILFFLHLLINNELRCWMLWFWCDISGKLSLRYWVIWRWVSIKSRTSLQNPLLQFLGIISGSLFIYPSYYYQIIHIIAENVETSFLLQVSGI